MAEMVRIVAESVAVEVKGQMEMEECVGRRLEGTAVSKYHTLSGNSGRRHFINGLPFIKSENRLFSGRE